MEKLVNDLINEIVKNEIGLSNLAYFVESDDFKIFDDRQKVLIEKQGKLMAELNEVLKARISNMIISKDEGKPENGEDDVANARFE